MFVSFQTFLWAGYIHTYSRIIEFRVYSRPDTTALVVEELN